MNGWPWGSEVQILNGNLEQALWSGGLYTFPVSDLELPPRFLYNKHILGRMLQYVLSEYMTM